MPASQQLHRLSHPRAHHRVEANKRQLIAQEAEEAIPKLEFDQTANQAAEAGHERLVAGAAAETIPEPEFDRTLGW